MKFEHTNDQPPEITPGFADPPSDVIPTDFPPQLSQQEVAQQIRDTSQPPSEVFDLGDEPEGAGPETGSVDNDRIAPIIIPGLTDESGKLLEPASGRTAESTPTETIEVLSEASQAETTGEDQPREYRIKGELEQANPEIEPLPPTPITDEARAQLKEWGLSDEHIDKVRDLTSSFRYDLCDEKLDRLVGNGGVVVGELPGKGEVVVLPEVLNHDQRGDGACSDIAVQQMRAMEESGLLNEINTELQASGRPPIDPLWSYGYSRTHFTDDDAVHVWTGLAPRGAPKERGVITDASFQEISTLEQSGYRPVTTARKHELDIKHDRTSIAVEMGKYEEANGLYSLHCPKRFTIGMSNDKAVAYQLGFAKDTSTNQIRPLISVKLPHDNPDISVPVCIRSREGALNFHRDEELTPAQREEMVGLLEKVKNIPIVRNLDWVREQAGQARIAVQ